MPEASSDRLVPIPGDVIRQASPGADDLERSVELLRQVASGDGPERLLRLYTPAPTLALTRRESLMPGYDIAVAAAERLGFTPAIRPTGGRAAAYDETCLVFDLVEREESHADPTALFAQAGRTIVDALRGLGVDARLGEVPGEYCPGAYSINARGAVKLVGTSQRGVRGARLGRDDRDFLFDRLDDLPVDGVRERVAVGFRGPPPQQMDADGAHQDRGEDEA